MMDRVVPGGVASDHTQCWRSRVIARAALDNIRQRFPRLVELYDNTASLQDRTVGTGIVRADLHGNSAPAAMSGAPAAAISMRAEHWPMRLTIELDFDGSGADRGRRQCARLDPHPRSRAKPLADRPDHWTSAGGADRDRRCSVRRTAKDWAWSKAFAATCWSGCGSTDGAVVALPPARSVVVSMAAAGSRDRGQHRRRFPALQQIVQLLLFGA